jgi:CHAT domain
MRFIIQVDSSASEESWEVRIRPDDMSGPVLAERTMAVLADPNDLKKTFPGLPRRQAPAAGHSLCEASTPDDLWDAFFRLLTRNVDRATIQDFGSYLFEVLLGEDIWQKILAQAGSEPVELALSWAESEWALTRLPWEMLRFGDTYLAALAQPPVAISRLVRGASRGKPGLQVTPRVLFVIGASLTDGQIRAGAEYMELLRHLRDQGCYDCGLVTEIVLEASPQRLRAAMERFDPSVVHFICHGGVRPAQDGFEGFLQMMSDDEESGETEPRTAEQLVSILIRDRPEPPPVVVLNACYSGAQPPAERPAAPLATEMVKHGVPIVVAMWGRVSDRACRLFTWCFYEALLRSKSVTHAVAAGRRMAFEGQADPAGIDWAFPAIFLDETVTSVALDQEAAVRIGKLESIAFAYRQLDTPPFCDRLEILERSYRQLLNAGEKGPRILAIKVALAEQGSFRYGKTRSLEEICVKLVTDGHLPCFVRADDVTQSTKPFDLARAIAGAIGIARDRFGLETLVDYEIFKLTETDGRKVLAPRVTAQLKLHPLKEPAAGPDELHNQVVAAAIYQDLLNLAEEARDTALEPRVVLLFDDVHRFVPDTLQLLVENLLVPGCLSGPRNHVPVVMAFSTAGRKIEYGPSAKDLAPFLENNHLVIRPLPELQPLPDPDQDRYPWEQFLMGQKPPLVAGISSQPDDVQNAFKKFYALTCNGAPSMLIDRTLGAVVEVYASLRVLVTADDTDLLRSWRNQ